VRYDKSVEPLDDRGRIVARLLADRYDLLGLLGKGGFAAVYQVRSHTLKRLEALKVLLERHDEGSDFARRFTQEARVAASLEHPGIVKIYDFGHAEGIFWYSMQLVPGPTLTRRLAELGTLDEETAARIGAALADALDYSHTRGVIHRDIKPGNVILDAGGRPYLTDFGIAKVGDNLIKTQTGFILGSPPYLSPEQIRGQLLDGRSDLYSLGITLYQILSGAVPFRSDDAVQALARRLAEEARPLSEKRPGIHPELERIVMRALRRSRDERYPSAGEMRDDLESFLSAAYPRTTAQTRMRRSGAETPAAASDDTPTLRTAAGTPSRKDQPAAFSVEGRAGSVPVPSAVLPATPQPAALPSSGVLRVLPSRSLFLAAGGAVVLVLVFLLVSRTGRRTEPSVSIPDLRAARPLPTLAPGPPTPLPTLPPTAVPTPVEETPTPRRAVSHIASRPVRSPVPPDSGPIPRRIKYPADITRDVPVALPPDLAASCIGRTVGLHLVIGEDGSLKSAKVISSSTLAGCDAAALDAVRRYEFKPALDMEEKPIEGKLLISVHF
jgi:TonB family protein